MLSQPAYQLDNLWYKKQPHFTARLTATDCPASHMQSICVCTRCLMKPTETSSDIAFTRYKSF